MVFLSGYDIGYKPLNDAIQVIETIEEQPEKHELEGGDTNDNSDTEENAAGNTEETGSNKLLI